MEKIYKKSELVEGQLDDNQIIMDIERGKYFGLNSLGRKIWELLESPLTLDEIINRLLSEYQVSEEICHKEVSSFINKAISLGIIEKREENI